MMEYIIYIDSNDCWDCVFPHFWIEEQFHFYKKQLYLPRQKHSCFIVELNSKCAQRHSYRRSALKVMNCDSYLLPLNSTLHCPSLC